MGCCKLEHIDKGSLETFNPFFSVVQGEKNATKKLTLNYSPFGVELDGRTQETDFYRYSFQNQEKDDEVKGKGNSVNYKYRMHDPRVGRFFAVDPLAFKYPYNGVYNFSENRVIEGVELEGLEFGGSPLSYSTIGLGRDLETWTQSPQAQTAADVAIGTMYVVGGVIALVATGGAAGPAIAAGTITTGGWVGTGFAVSSAIYQIGSGGTQIALSLSGNSEYIDDIPGGVIDAIVGVTLEYTLDGTKYEEYVPVSRSALNVIEGVLTLNLKSLPKTLAEATDLSFSSISVSQDIIETNRLIEDMLGGTINEVQNTKDTQEGEKLNNGINTIQGTVSRKEKISPDRFSKPVNVSKIIDDVDTFLKADEK